MAIATIPQSGTNGLTSLAGLIQALAPVFLGTGAQTVNSSGSNTSTNTSSIPTDITAAIQALLGGIQGQNAGYTKDAAISDSNNLINGLVMDALRQNMPGVLGGAKTAGLYNDTTTQLLTNDLAARIAESAAKAQQSTVQSYADISSRNNNTAAGILNGLAQANKTQTQTQTTNDTKTSTTAPTVSRGTTLGGLGALSALSLLKNGKDIFNSGRDLLGFGTGNDGAIAPVFSGISGGNFNDAVDSDVLSGMSGFGGGTDFTAAADSLSSALGGAFDPSGVNWGSLFDLGSSAGSISDAASSIGDFAGVGSGLSGVFTDNGTDLGSGLSGIFTGGDTSGGSDLLGGIGDLGKKFLDSFGDIGSSIGSFFGGFFAEGGEVPSAPTGREGGFAYDESGQEAKLARGYQGLQRARALWELIQAQDPAAVTNTNAPTVIAGNEDAAGGASRPATQQASSTPTTKDQVLQLVRSKVEKAQEDQREAIAAQDNTLSNAKSGLSQARGAEKISNIVDASLGSSAATSLAAAQGIGGAAAATAGGISGGAGALGTTVGGADVLGSLAGGTGFLPAYGGTASGIFGSSAAAAGGEAAGSTAAATGGTAGADIGLGSAGAAAGALSFPLLLKGAADLIFNGVTERSQSDLDSWQLLSKKLKDGTAGDDWLNAGLGIFDQFFNPSVANNQDLSAAQKYDNLTNWLLQGGLAEGGSNTGNAAAPYVADVGAYLRDNPGAIQQGLDSSQGIQDFWNSPTNQAGGMFNSAGGLSLANGGAIPKQAGDPKGVADNVRINASGGEFVSSKPVVDALGADFFNKLEQIFGVPAAAR